MTLNEFDQPMAKGLYDPTSDKLAKASMDDTRKNVLTLKDLNRLKKLRAFRRLEDLRHQDSLAMIYGQTGDDDGGDF